MKGISRINRIRTMTTEEMAKVLVSIEDIDIDFCKSDCEGDFESDNPNEICPHPIECCIKWLGEEWDKEAVE